MQFGGYILAIGNLTVKKVPCLWFHDSVKHSMNDDHGFRTTYNMFSYWSYLVHWSYPCWRGFMSPHLNHNGQNWNVALPNREEHLVDKKDTKYNGVSLLHASAIGIDSHFMPLHILSASLVTLFPSARAQVNTGFPATRRGRMQKETEFSGNNQCV